MRYTDRLADADIAPSVGSQGDAFDNALAESVIALYKTEVIRRRGPWRSLEAVEFATLEVGGLVQHAAAARSHRGRTARRIRSAVLCSGCSGLIQRTWSPKFPVRFNLRVLRDEQRV